MSVEARRGHGVGACVRPWLVLAGLFAFAPSVSAQSSAPPGDYIRRSAPDVVMPDTPRDAQGRPVHTTRRAAEVLGDSVLRGAIGQVPQAPGECRIQDDQGTTVVSYENGLPVRALRTVQEVREEQRLWSWDPERVLLLQESWSVRIKTPAERRGSEDTWRAAEWRVESTAWDSYGRPLTRETNDGAGSSTSLLCEWFGFRRGDCRLGGVEKADVRLNVGGEVESVSWSQVGSGQARGEWRGTWDDSLRTVSRARGTSLSREEYRYDGEGRLERFRRFETLPRGERTLTWSLRRDERGNVTEVQRRCEGPCAGVRGAVRFRITYDETLRNTLCGAWWDDGIEPTLRGW